MRPSIHSVSILAAALLLAPLARAAGDVTVSPANRIVVVDQGKSATVKVKVDGCAPTWSASSDDTKVADVSDPGDKAGGSRSFKITAADVFGQSTTVSLFVDGVGENCDEQQQIDIQVFVVMDANHVEVAFANGDKGADIPGVKKVLAAYRKELKAVEKAYKDDLKQILADMKAGTLPVPELPEGPGAGSHLNQFQRAMIFMSLAYMVVLNNVYALYWSHLPQMAFCGFNALLLYGFLPFLAFAAPVSMQPGGCGVWDQSRLLAFTLMLATLSSVGSMNKTFTSTVEKESAKAGTPLVCSETDNPVCDPGDGGTSPITAKVPDEQLNKQLQIQKLQANNAIGSDNPDQGRITVMGQAKGASVTITFQQLGSVGQAIGEPQVDVFPVDTDNCAFGVFWPDLSESGNLAPGTWRVTVNDGDGNAQSQMVTVPVT